MAVLMPLGRAAGGCRRGEQATRVYLDQLGELERDRAERPHRRRRGGSGAGGDRAAADRRRRRRRGARAAATGSRGARRPRRSPRSSASRSSRSRLYLGTRMRPTCRASRSQPAFPHRLPPTTSSVLIAKVEAHLAKHPEDGQGWEVIAPVYLRLGRGEEAATAYRNAIRLLGSTAARQTGLGEAILASRRRHRHRRCARGLRGGTALDPRRPARASIWRLPRSRRASRRKRQRRCARCWRTRPPTRPGAAPWRAALARVEPGAQPTGPECRAGRAAAETWPRPTGLR